MSEITERQIHGGLVIGVGAGSLAEAMGVLPGDTLLAVNDEIVEDVIDVQFYAAEYAVELRVERQGREILLRGQRHDMQPLGLEFSHPTFDVDIRRCNNLCEFCFVLQMSPRFRRTLYIKDDDYRYSFLFGHYVTLTNLSEHDEWRIVEQHLSPLYVSVHATELALRRECLRNNSAPDILDQLAWLVDEGIEVHTQIVVTPGLNDGPHLEKSVTDLVGLYPGVRSVTVVPVGLTRHHKYGKRSNTAREAEIILDACAEWQQAFREALGVGLVYPTDEWFLMTGRAVPLKSEYDGLDLTENGLGMVRRLEDDWDAVRGELAELPKVEALTLATGTLFAPTLKRHTDSFAAICGVQTRVVPITNRRLGETITVAGLLMGKDIIDQLGGEDLGDVLVLPRLMFDHPDGISLDDVSPLQIAQTLKRPVALADLMGDLVDIIYGKPALWFDPDGETLISPRNIGKEGGWAVEKYL